MFCSSQPAMAQTEYGGTMTSLLVDEGDKRQNEQMFKEKEKEKFFNGNDAPHTNGNGEHLNGGGARINGNGAHPGNGHAPLHINGNGHGAGHDGENVIIRHYKPEDRAAIRRI